MLSYRIIMDFGVTNQTDMSAIFPGDLMKRSSNTGKVWYEASVVRT